MNPDENQPIPTRVYSAARMKRRASIQRKLAQKPDENLLNAIRREAPPETKGTEVPRETTRAEGPRETTRREVPPEAKRTEVPLETTRAEGPRETKRTEIPRETTRAEGPREKTRAEGPRETKRTEIPRETTRAEVPRETKRKEIPRETKRTEIPRETTRTEVPRETKRTEAPRETKRTEVPRETKRTEVPREREAPDEIKRREPPSEPLKRTDQRDNRTTNRTKEEYQPKKRAQFLSDSENISPEVEGSVRPDRSKRLSVGEASKNPLQEKLTSEKNNKRPKETLKKSDSSFDSSDSSSHAVNSPEELSSSSPKGREKFMILCSLLPDEILRDPVTQSIRFYQCALMFPDVSGFTQLCQKYDKTGMGGPSRLTAVLNGYIGSMIKIVLSRQGDVCKFGGDAFLCSWKVTDDMSLTEVVHLAIESAIDIQKNCGEHKTDVGVKLRVKIAVAAGNAVFSIVGSKSKKHYVVVGPPVLEVRDAEQLCRAGDVIVTPSAWKYVTNYMFYSFTYHTDNVHVKVHDFGPLWISSNKDKGKGATSGIVRPFLKTHLSLRVQDVEPFILPPVMKSIDQDRSLDHLTEMRQVAIVFFNITLDFVALPVREVVHLSNQAFQIVSAKVDKDGGATNKLTLFDKDMAILTVFGLKGFKHELASQVALKCAHSCLEPLKKLPKIITASAGVTTGMAYCGVIGHPQRKEYTVMGHPVNMAARLMCAYQNIVSCDRSTFLNSKLESGHFELLELESLKGIQNAGPFYKFNVNPERVKLKLDHEGMPILGREREVKEFEEFFRRGSALESQINFFIIFGTARIGKSRLVAKLVSVAQGMERATKEVGKKHTEVTLVPLTEDDYKVAYSTIRLIFQPLLGLSDSPTVQEREDKILVTLKEFNDLHMLASFNQIFNVNFDMTPQYLALGEREHSIARMSWLTKLYQKCFPKGGDKWLIVIEDAEFVDEESWHFLTWCSLESQKALYLMTIGQKKALSHSATNCLERIKAKRITLTEIEKWFYLGLACQILGVEAIPVELESLLQSYKNSGNPGWMESFLLSLLQSGGVYIGQASSAKIKSTGMVSPPEYMLSNRAVENKGDSHWMDFVETFESMDSENQRTFRVCFLGPNFPKGGENVEDLTMDVMFIKTMDGLNPLEQLVLKAGSVLGNNIKRTALMFIISKDTAVDDRALAKATKKFFDMKILICGRGDLTQKNQLISRRILTSSIRTGLTCECIGLEIPETCKDLPRYANCGYMQFRFPSVRDTVYNLLLDDQKKNFHNGCIEFLRENTFRCKSCKNLKFKNVFGYVEDDKVVLACTTTSTHGIRFTTLEPKNDFPVPSLKDRLMGSRASQRQSFLPSDLVASEEQGAISVPNVGDCQCSQILASLYSVLLEHAAGSGRKDLMLEIKLESAAVNLFMYNIPLTMQILENALELVNEMKENKEYPEFCTPYIFSKIYTMMGATKLNMGRLDESLELLLKSLKIMRHHFPRNRFSVRLNIVKHLTMLKMANYFPAKFLGRVPTSRAHVTDLLSENLGLMSAVYMYMRKDLSAKNASLWSLRKALDYNRNLYVICSAYSTLIEVYYWEKDFKSCGELELYANHFCKRCSNNDIELYEWEAIGKLYKIIFQTRYVRAEIESAVYIGFQSLNIASLIHSTDLKLDLLPDLIFALIQLGRLSEAVTLLHELENISRLDSDKSGRLWYYSICLDFQLYTGFTIVPFETCESFCKAEEDLALVRDPFAKHRLYNSIWLWCVRNHELELIKFYGNLLKGSEVYKDEANPCTVFTRLQRLEGLLISVVYKMDARNVQSTNQILGEVNVFMNRLKKDVKSIKLFKPRFLLLETYYRQIRYRDNSYPRLLSRALAQAEKMKDQNTAQWIRHLKLLWANAISQIDRDHWVDHCRKNIIEWTDSTEISKKPVILYSLPLPKF